MRNVLKGLSLLLLLNQPLEVVAENLDEAAIKTMVESVAVLADGGHFESLEQLFADPVKVDYTSAFGGKVELKSPRELMTAWAGVLPGFDRTRHDLSAIVVNVDKDSATAKANVIADHYIEGKEWQVSGGYDYAFARRDGEWKISAMTFILRDEKGSRDLLGLAAKAAAKNPASYVLRQQTQQAVRDFLTSLEEKDMEKFASVWADDAVQDMPYSPAGFPKRVEGKRNLVKHYAGWPQASGKASFTKDLVFYPLQDPEKVYVEYRGRVDVIPTGRLYEQVYGGLFHVQQGKIKLFREYFDPIAFQYAFGLDGNDQPGSKQ